MASPAIMLMAVMCMCMGMAMVMVMAMTVTMMFVVMVVDGIIEPEFWHSISNYPPHHTNPSKSIPKTILNVCWQCEKQGLRGADNKRYS